MLLPLHTTLLLFSGHSGSRSMTTFAARWADYQANQRGNRGSSPATTGSKGGTWRWSTADYPALEEAVVRVRMGLLLVGVETCETALLAIDDVLPSFA